MHMFYFLFFLFFSCSKKNPITWDTCSNVVQDHPCDFTLVDQHGKEWNLYENYGKAIIIDFSAEWCYWCKVAASDINNVEQAYDVTYVTVMLEDSAGNKADDKLVRRWAALFQINSPVLIGPQELTWNVEAFPTFYIINKEMIVTGIMEGYNPHMLEAYVKETQ